MKRFVIVLLAILMLSCSSSQMNEPHLIYYRTYIDRSVWIGKHEIDLANLKTNELLFPVISIAFDEITRQLWAFSYSEDNKYICFYDITNRTIDIDKGIFVERFKKLYHCDQIFNNKILYTVDNRNFEIIDLVTLNRVAFAINDIDGKPPMGYPQDPLGFSDDKVIFRNGYYSINDQEYYLFNNIKYPRFIASNEKVIGLNSSNYIVIYDLNSKATENTNIKREMLKYSKYDGNDLYFLENDKLFFSKDIKGLYRIIVNFLPIGPSRREWYMYDLKERKSTKLTTPDDMLIILGSYDNANPNSQ